MIAILLAVGCTPDDSGQTGPGTIPTPPLTPPELTDPDAPWLEDATTEDVSIDLDAVIAAVDGAIVEFVALDPTPLVDAYRAGMTASEPGCPSYYDDYTYGTYWLDSCTAGSGAQFDGYGIDNTDYGVDLGDGLYGDILTLGGVGTVTQPDGTHVDYNGYIQTLMASDLSGTITMQQTVITGDFDTNDPGISGTWVADGLQPSATILRYGIVGTGGATIVSGVLQGLGGEFPTVVFDEAVIADPLTGATNCAEEPSGTASVQLPDGQWVDIVFDPRFDGETISAESGSCDGCGTAWHKTDNLGPVCFDFSPWLQ